MERRFAAGLCVAFPYGEALLQRLTGVDFFPTWFIVAGLAAGLFLLLPRRAFNWCIQIPRQLVSHSVAKEMSSWKKAFGEEFDWIGQALRSRNYWVMVFIAVVLMVILPIALIWLVEKFV